MARTASTPSCTVSATSRSLRGASHPRELVSTAAELGYAGLALTDECSVAGVVRAHTAAKELPLKLLVGSELICDADGLKIVVLAEDRHAYAALCAAHQPSAARGSQRRVSRRPRRRRRVLASARLIALAAELLRPADAQTGVGCKSVSPGVYGWLSSS